MRRDLLNSFMLITDGINDTEQRGKPCVWGPSMPSIKNNGCWRRADVYKATIGLAGTVFEMESHAFQPRLA